jgi:hypothetical protein
MGAFTLAAGSSSSTTAASPKLIRGFEGAYVLQQRYREITRRPWRYREIRSRRAVRPVGARQEIAKRLSLSDSPQVITGAGIPG